MKTQEMKNLKLNYHMLEGCNYGCKFCFAEFGNIRQLKATEMFKVVEKTATSGCFSAINFAGGEPFLVKELPDLIKYAKQLGLDTSVITNGSRLDRPMLDKILPYIDCLGISVHSSSDETKRQIGSCSNKGATLGNEQLKHICEYVRANSNCKIKINTVVNAYNKDEVLAPFVKTLDVDRWKIMRCKLFNTNSPLLISDAEWNKFIANNQGVKSSVIEGDMQNSYIIVNPTGDLITEGFHNASYDRLGSVLCDDMKTLLDKLPFNNEVYQQRYRRA
jgi:radical S-adenosyl methionine domain-containing protein 2